MRRITSETKRGSSWDLLPLIENWEGGIKLLLISRQCTCKTEFLLLARFYSQMSYYNIKRKDDLPATEIWITWFNCFPNKWRRKEVKESEQTGIHRPPFDIEFLNKWVHVIWWYEKQASNNHSNQKMTWMLVWVRIWGKDCPDCLHFQSIKNTTRLLIDPH